jgi:hypothetical protein
MFSDRVEQLLSQPVTVEPKAGKRDWGFTQEYAPHDPNSSTITATVGQKLEGEDDWTEFVLANGGSLAPGYRVRLVEMRHNTAGWTRAAQGEDATTTGTWFYKFAVEPITSQARIDELIRDIGKRKAPTKTSSGEGVFHFLAGDLQLGKCDGDSTQGITDRFLDSVENAVADFKTLRRSRNLGTVHIGFLGDCGEGNQSQNGRNMWRTELTVTEQYRLFRRLMLFTIDAFAPLVDNVQLDVVNGNHDQVQRFQETRGDDGHATESAIALADALELNPAAYGHVQVFVPNKDETYITRQIGTSVATMAHGHQWARGKAMEWWKGQGFNGHAPQASQFLFHGHEHTFGIQSKKDRVVICTPTYESESTWWRHKTGDLAIRGGLVLTTADGSFADLRVV